MTAVPQVGPFELIAKIGEGGMGEVWRARDSRLERIVALKLLSANRQSYPSGRERLLREAQSASALNHPNIVTIYEIGSAGDRDFIAMELVEGQVLSDVIRGKPIQPIAALKIAIQIAAAASAAHQAGVIHRDLKPPNVLVRNDGVVKVLDFGLAKRTGPIGEQDDTKTAALTEEGAIVGTVAYMSPEQAESKSIDARSDIFSFGAVLYEMLTGERAFQGDSRMSTLAAVLKGEPRPVSSIVPALPLELQRIVNRCLKKDPEKRFQTMADVRVALEEMLDESTSGQLARPAARNPARMWRAVLSGVAAAAAVFALWWALRNRIPPEVPRRTLVRLTPNDGNLYTEPNISKDGRFVVYVSNKSGGRNLWLQHTNAKEALQSTRSMHWVGNQTISPDGSQVYQENLPEGTFIRRVSMVGGQPETIVRGQFPLLSPDGSHIAYVTSDGERRHLFVRPVNGGAARELTNFEPRAQGGRCLAWPVPTLLICNMPIESTSQGARFDTFLIPIDGSTAHKHNAQEWFERYGFEGGARFGIKTARAGIFSARRNSDSPFNLWEMNLRSKTFHFEGPPQQLTFGSIDESYPSASDEGVVAFSNQEVTQDFFWLPLDTASGRILGPVRPLTRDGRRKELSNSGSSFGFTSFYLYGPCRSADPFVLDGTTGAQIPLTTTRVLESFHFNQNREANQVITAVADDSGYSVRLYTIRDGSVKASETLCTDCSEHWTVTADWRKLVYSPTTNRKSLRVLDLATRESVEWASHPDSSFKWLVPVAGKWIAAALQRTGTDSSESRVLIPWRENGRPAVTEWRPDPVYRRLKPTYLSENAFPPHCYYLEKVENRERLMHFHMDPITLTTSEARPVEGYEKLPIKPSSLYPWNVAPDGIVFQYAQPRGDIWLLRPETK